MVEEENNWSCVFGLGGKQGWDTTGCTGVGKNFGFPRGHCLVDMPKVVGGGSREPQSHSRQEAEQPTVRPVAGNLLAFPNRFAQCGGGCREFLKV